MPLAQRLPAQGSAVRSRPAPPLLAHSRALASQAGQGLSRSAALVCTCRARRPRNARSGVEALRPLWRGALGWVADQWRAALMPDEERRAGLLLHGRRVALDQISRLLQIREAALELAQAARAGQQQVAQAMAASPELGRLALELQVARAPADLAAVAVHEARARQLGDLQLLGLKLAQCQLEAQRLAVASMQVALRLQPLASARVQYVGASLCLGQEELSEAVLARAIGPVGPTREAQEALTRRLGELQGEVEQARKQAGRQLAALGAQQRRRA